VLPFHGSALTTPPLCLAHKWLMLAFAQSQASLGRDTPLKPLEPTHSVATCGSFRQPKGKHVSQSGDTKRKDALKPV